jgi:hypothetical protein
VSVEPEERGEPHAARGEFSRAEKRFCVGSNYSKQLWKFEAFCHGCCRPRLLLRVRSTEKVLLLLLLLLLLLGGATAPTAAP